MLNDEMKLNWFDEKAAPDKKIRLIGIEAPSDPESRNAMLNFCASVQTRKAHEGHRVHLSTPRRAEAHLETDAVGPTSISPLVVPTGGAVEAATSDRSETCSRLHRKRKCGFRGGGEMQKDVCDLFEAENVGARHLKRSEKMVQIRHPFQKSSTTSHQFIHVRKFWILLLHYTKLFQILQICMYACV